MHHNEYLVKIEAIELRCFEVLFRRKKGTRF
jgi:hypothetical protein